jgi:hypothetical protein
MLIVLKILVYYPDLFIPMHCLLLTIQVALIVIQLHTNFITHAWAFLTYILIETYIHFAYY